MRCTAAKLPYSLGGFGSNEKSIWAGNIELRAFLFTICLFQKSFVCFAILPQFSYMVSLAAGLICSAL